MEQLLTILCLLFTITSGLVDVPCAENSVGGKCISDEECYGTNALCLKGRCRCPVGFDESLVNNKVKVCKPAADSAGAACRKHCKPPWICDDATKKCVCFEGEVKNGKCIVKCGIKGETPRAADGSCVRTAHYDQACSTTPDCVDPLTWCVRAQISQRPRRFANRCRCGKGIVRRSGQCVAKCPDGTLITDKKVEVCRRHDINDLDMLDHSSGMDSCPSGFQCVTHGRPHIGHCCPLLCPYGNSIDRSCGMTDKNCPESTHYCHQIGSLGYQKSICCPRPCPEHLPMFVGGKCIAEGHFGDACESDEQCEGGNTMQCTKNQCKCKKDFVPDSSGRFPTCIKRCNKGYVSVQGECKAVASLGERCACSAQCPRNSRCYNGKCECKCGYKTSEILGIKQDSCSEGSNINPLDIFNINLKATSC